MNIRPLKQTGRDDSRICFVRRRRDISSPANCGHQAPQVSTIVSLPFAKIRTVYSCWISQVGSLKSVVFLHLARLAASELNIAFIIKGLILISGNKSKMFGLFPITRFPGFFLELERRFHMPPFSRYSFLPRWKNFTIFFSEAVLASSELSYRAEREREAPKDSAPMRSRAGNAPDS